MASLTAGWATLGDAQRSAGSVADQPATGRRAPRLLKRLLFLSHPCAWECQFYGKPEAAAKPRYAGYAGTELIEMECRISRLWPDEIRRLGPEDALVVNSAGGSNPRLVAAAGPLGPACEAAQKHMRDRCLITVSGPGEAYGRKLLDQFRSRGHTFDPRTLVGEGRGQSFEGCLPRWAGGIAAAIGMRRGIPMRYDMTFPDAPFAMTGAFAERLAIGQTDVYLYLFASEDERPFGIFFPGVIRDIEPPRFAKCSADPNKVEFTTKRAEPRQLRPREQTFAVRLNIDGRGDPIYVWSKGLSAPEFKNVLAAVQIEAPVNDGPHGRLRTVGHADLAKNLLDVLLDGLVADAQRRCNILVRRSVDQFPRHLTLALGQRDFAVAGQSWR